MGVALEGPTEIFTADPAEFGARIRQFARGPVRVGSIGPRGFGARARAWGLPRIGLFQVRIDQGRVVSPPRPRVLSLTVTLSGAFEARHGNHSAAVGPGACFARDDTDTMDLTIPRACMLVANVDRQLLDETASKLAGGDPHPADEAEPMISLDTPEGSQLWRRLAATWRELNEQGTSQLSAPAVAETEVGIAEALVRAMGIGATDRVRDCGAVYLRRAEEFILANLSNPISRADICAAAGVSARSLSRRFVGRHGMGPITFLKQRRLEAAQRSLLAADPAERSVTDVATEWGLHHLGRFSVEYRAAFGEPPSRTLGR